MKKKKSKKVTTKKKLTDQMSGKQRRRVVRIFNLSEDVWPFIKAMSDEEAKKREIEENANLSDRDLFSESEEFGFTFITAKPIKTEFVDYFKKLCLVKDLEILVPKNHSGRLCEDILKDEKILNKLEEMGRQYQKIELKPYSTTVSFLKLAKKLKTLGVNVITPISPTRYNSWTVNFYGSKSGIRQLTQINGALRYDLKMPDGMITSGIVDSARMAANKFVKEGGVVIKTNKGHAGMGVLIFRKGELPKQFNQCEKAILKILKRDTYWKKFPIIIESLVEPDKKIGGGFPNAEFMITQRGEVKLLYYCGMRVNEQGVFAGVEVSEAALPRRVASRIIDIGYLIGEQYASDGYVGYFDIDFIAAKNGQIYVNESNVRVTGGTHVYQAAKELAGRNFTKNSYVLSNNTYDIPGKKKYKFEILLKLIKPILYSRKTREGVVIASANLLVQSKLAYIIFGKNKKRAELIESEMMKIIS